MAFNGRGSMSRQELRSRRDVKRMTRARPEPQDGMVKRSGVLPSRSVKP